MCLIKILEIQSVKLTHTPVCPKPEISTSISHSAINIVTCDAILRAQASEILDANPIISADSREFGH